MLACDAALAAARATHWFVRETSACCARALARLDVTARTLFALVEPGSCFAGTLLELALAADRIYMLALPTTPARAAIALSRAERGALPDARTACSRLAARFYGEAEPVAAARARDRRAARRRATRSTLGLVTFAPDDIDWDDELRLALEERAASRPTRSPAWRRTCASAGPETMETQDLRPPLGLAELDLHRAQRRRRARARSRCYGTGSRPEFDWRPQPERDRAQDRR